MGLINAKIEILKKRYANTVPGFYRIKSKYKNKKITKLNSNFFFYLLGTKKGNIFNVRGNLIKKKTWFGDKYYLSLNSWGEYRNFFMNKIN